jgi:glutamyl-tRNA synthetase
MTTPKRVRTRFAPSPTGDLHIGGARSALFAYLWAKKQGGDFLLRIEDTDQERFVEGSEGTIFKGLEWLGITPDESPRHAGEYGPYKQSERTDLYTKHTNQLLENGDAYRCFCTAQELKAMREEQQQLKQAPRYSGRCRELSSEEAQSKITAGTSFVVRLKVPTEGSVTVSDIIRGEVTFDVKDIDDQVLMKSDGFPTYHLANVVDDHHMEITHVIRGEEWLPSTPKHILLYKAFGWDVPTFAHLSLFLAKGGGKMSKRHGETSLLAFQEKGYLPEAIVNFMALLGWNPKTEEEFFSLDQLVERFDLAHVNKANPVFETEKLDWMNQHYMKQLSLKDALPMLDMIGEGKTAEWFTGISDVRAQSVWESLRDRSVTLKETSEVLTWLTPRTYEPQDLIWKKSDRETTIQVLEQLIIGTKEYTDEQFVRAVLEPECIAWIKTTEWGNGDVLWPMRFALSGEKTLTFAI